MRTLWVPLVFGTALGLLGRRSGGDAVGLFMAVLGLVLAWGLGRALRLRRLRKAPPPPTLLPGERALLHGPLHLLEAPGRKREVWGYLSDRRLHLCPSDGGDGLDLDLARLDEIRPLRRGYLGGEIGLLLGRDLWRLKVPDYERWMEALRKAARGV